MSGADFKAIDSYSRGLSKTPDTHCCYQHIHNTAVTKFIKSKAKIGKCDYCGKDTRVVSFEKLMRFLMEAVDHFYKDPDEFMRPLHGGGYDGTVYDGWEVLSDCFALNMDEEILEDVRNSIEYDKGWGDEAEYFGDESDFLRYQWEYFVRVVKHRARYFFGNTNDLRSSQYRLKPYEILKDIGTKIIHFKLVKTIRSGTKLYRCRQHNQKERLTTDASLASPPSDYATQANRMSPAGISMFYGAFDHATSLAETIDYTNEKSPYYTIGTFKTKTELVIIDLSSIPEIPSVFDQRQWNQFYHIIFLHDFVKDLVKPISRDAKVHIEYVPTQVVTEFFRYAFKNNRRKRIKVDGIVYPSSRISGEKACVLFFDHEESRQQLEFLPAELTRKKVNFPSKLKQPHAK